MKFKTFTSLVLGAILSAWVIVASAQTNNAFEASVDPFDNLPHECVTRSDRGSDFLQVLPEKVVTQTFTSCASGAFKGAYLELYKVIGSGDLMFAISGNGLYWATTISLEEGDTGLIRIAEDLNLLEGATYQIKMRPTAGLTVKFWCTKNAGASTELIYDGWTLDGTLNYAVGVDGSEMITSSVQTGKAPSDGHTADISKPDVPMSADDLFLVYPNPFYTDCNISFDHTLRGATEITLSDAQGNTRYTTVRTEVVEGETINVMPTSGLEPGIYVLRVLNEGKVYHKTIMKN